MTIRDRERWEKRYAQRASRSTSPPGEWLEQKLRDLPRGGKALDLAAGDGANSLLLASRGWRVTAVDISPTGLALGRKVAGPLPIQWIEADLDTYEPESDAYDLVLCFRYLDRLRLPYLVDVALKPGGLLLAETFNVQAMEAPDCHITNPAYLLQLGEWLQLFPSFAVIEHEEIAGLSRVFARR